MRFGNRLPRLEFVARGEAFSLIVVGTVSDEDRRRMVEALDSWSMVRIHDEALRHVCGWENVIDADTGEPIPFHFRENGEVRTRLDQFLGQVPMPVFFRVLLGVCEYMKAESRFLDGLRYSLRID